MNDRGFRGGRFRGVGPRGFRRSDRRIYEDVCERLARHGYLDASHIEVEVHDQVVSLLGAVKDRWQKRLAEDLAESVPGVFDIDNQLRIVRPGQDAAKPCGEIREGMDVVGPRGKNIGKVKEVGENDFLVDRPEAPEVWVPYSACQSVNGKIVLNVRAEEIDRQGWRSHGAYQPGKRGNGNGEPA